MIRLIWTSVGMLSFSIDIIDQIHEYVSEIDH